MGKKQVKTSFMTFILLFLCIFGSYERAEASTTQCNLEESEALKVYSVQEINQLLTEEAIKQDVPPEVVKAVAQKESGWKQYDVNGLPLIGVDGLGIGIMQITNKKNYDQERLKYDTKYNICAGVEILSQMYERINSTSETYKLPSIQGANRQIIENWYFPVMAYNGTKPKNSPLFQATGQKNIEAYQEKVFQNMLQTNFHGDSNLALAEFPFSRSDFKYNTESDENIRFLKDSYELTSPTRMSGYYFKKNDRVFTKAAVTLRSNPTRDSKAVRTLANNEVVTITGVFKYDSSNLLTRQNVWYPIETIDGTKGYVSSAYIDQSRISIGRVSEELISGTINNVSAVMVLINNKTYNATINKQVFSIKLPKTPVKTKFTVYAKDKYGNALQQVTGTIVDKTAPVLTVNQINSKTKTITGKTEEKATVKLYINGKFKSTTIANTKGEYRFMINQQKAGTTMKVTAADAAKNLSTKSLKVTIAVSLNTVSDKQTTVKGYTDAKSTVKLYINGKLTQTKKADSKGMYTFTIKKQKAGTTIKVIVSDTKKNSSTKTIKVIDKTAPVKPTYKAFTSQSESVTGKAEKGAKVYLYKGKTKIAEATANNSGNYKLSIKNKKLKKNDKLSLYAVDKAKNKSAVVSITLKK